MPAQSPKTVEFQQGRKGSFRSPERGTSHRPAGLPAQGTICNLLPSPEEVFMALVALFSQNNLGPPKPSLLLARKDGGGRNTFIKIWRNSSAGQSGLRRSHPSDIHSRETVLQL